MIPAAAKDGLNLISWRRSFPCIRSPFHEIWRYHVMCRICYSNLKLGILNNQDVLIGYRCFVPLALQSNGFEWSRIAWGDIPRTKRPECVFMSKANDLLSGDLWASTEYFDIGFDKPSATLLAPCLTMTRSTQVSLCGSLCCSSAVREWLRALWSSSSSGFWCRFFSPNNLKVGS